MTGTRQHLNVELAPASGAALRNISPSPKRRRYRLHLCQLASPALLRRGRRALKAKPKERWRPAWGEVHVSGSAN
jgi:hypothetical protein